MTKPRCTECDRRREPYRPVAQLIDRTITFVCKRCWVEFDYPPFMWAEMSDLDVAALRRWQ